MKIFNIDLWIQVIINVNAQLDIMIMGKTFVKSATILGILFLFLLKMFSKTCFGPSFNNCESCDLITEHREFDSLAHTCMCTLNYFEIDLKC